MIKFFKFFDRFSQTPTLRVNGKVRPTTIFGSFIGFFTISVLIAVISIILHDYLSRLTYNVNSYVDNSARPDIDLKKFKLGFFISDQLGRKYLDQERLFTISAKLWEVYIPIFGYNVSEVVEFKNIPRIKCNEYKNNTLFYENFELASKVIDATCLDFTNLNKNLYGTHGNFGG